MSRFLFLAIVSLVAAFRTIAVADLIGLVDDQNQLVLRGDGQQVVAIEFASSAGLLVPLEDEAATPWELLIANSEQNVAVGNLGPAITIDGDLVTGIGYTGDDPATDLSATWGDESDTLIPLDVILDPGELLSGFVNLQGQIVLVGTGQEVAGVQFASESGQLVPVSDEPTIDASPFEFFLSNTPELITLGTLQSGVIVDGEVTIPVGYSGDDPESDLDANWGATGSTLQVPFVITREICGGELVADLDGDGAVGFTDFLILSENFGGPGEYEDGDLDCNGDINFPDFLILSRDFGTQLEAVTVPEPNSFTCASISLLLLLVLTRRR